MAPDVADEVVFRLVIGPASTSSIFTEPSRRRLHVKRKHVVVGVAARRHENRHSVPPCQVVGKADVTTIGDLLHPMVHALSQRSGAAAYAGTALLSPHNHY